MVDVRKNMSVTNVISENNFKAGTYRPFFDPTGSVNANLVTNERFVTSANSGTDALVLFPVHAPFFNIYTQITFTPNQGAARALVYGSDYFFGLPFLGATRSLNKGVSGAIYLVNNALAGTFSVNYHALGGDWTYSRTIDESNLFSLDNDINTTSWEQYANYTKTFPIIFSAWDKADASSVLDLGVAVSTLTGNLVSQVLDNGNKNAAAIAHIARQDNPHGTTKADIGLGNVANYPPATDQQAADPTNTTTYITPAQLALAFSTVTPAATDTSPGVMTLNQGNQIPDINNSTDGLTAQGFYNLASTQTNQLGKAVNHAQIGANFTPWNNTWPVTWNGSSYSSARSLLNGLQDYMKIRALELNMTTGKVWFPAGTNLPNLTLS